MAVSGLLALLDDVSAMLDDPSTVEQLAAEKAAKIAEDDITGNINAKQKLDAKHEIHVIMAVAKGALKNKVLYFIPTTFAIAVFAPWAIVPLSLGSGAYIAYEGIKKVMHNADPEKAAKHRDALMKAKQGGKETLLRYEQEKIAQAIKTDAALSLELTGFQLGMVTGAPVLTKLAVVGIASVGATALLYTTIIGIIGMNGVARSLAARRGDGRLAKAQRWTGKKMMRLSSPIMKSISFAGMAALFYVGGHLLGAYLPGAEHAYGAIAEAVTKSPLVQGIVEIGATLATGLAGGLATYGGIKVVKKLTRPLRKAAAHLHETRIAPAALLMKCAWQMLRHGVPATTAPQPAAPLIIPPRATDYNLPPLPEGLHDAFRAATEQAAETQPQPEATPVPRNQPAAPPPI